jgi:hypothetical protein
MWKEGRYEASAKTNVARVRNHLLFLLGDRQERLREVHFLILADDLNYKHGRGILGDSHQITDESAMEPEIQTAKCGRL